MVIAVPSGLLQLISDMMSEGWFITAQKRAISLLINERVNQFLVLGEDGIPLVPRGCFRVQALSNWAGDCWTKQHVLLPGPGFILPVSSKITATKGEFWLLKTLMSLDGVLASNGVQNAQWFAAKQMMEIRKGKNGLMFMLQDHSLTGLHFPHKFSSSSQDWTLKHSF